MQEKRGKINGNEGVKPNEGLVLCGESENHVPDGCSIKCGKAYAEPKGGPIQNWH